MVLEFRFVYRGFFGTGMGRAILFSGYLCAVFSAFLLLARIGANPNAQKGAKGLIVGEVRRHDERDLVFARNRTLRPGSEQYEAYYREHPEKEEFDAQRRDRGGPIGIPGIIDRPHSDANVAMTLASLNIPHHLSTQDKVKPKPHPLLKEKLKTKKVKLSPEEATERVKGYTRNIGADLVGIAKIDPLWVYSHRGFRWVRP